MTAKAAFALSVVVEEKKVVDGCMDVVEGVDWSSVVAPKSAMSSESDEVECTEGVEVVEVVEGLEGLGDAESDEEEDDDASDESCSRDPEPVL